MVEPVRDSAAVVLKNADRAVIVPSRGTENAKFVNVPAAFVRSIVVPASPGRPGRTGRSQRTSGISWYSRSHRPYRPHRL